MAPFHIKAQILRQAQLEPAAALGVFAERTGGADVPSPTARPTGKAGWYDGIFFRPVRRRRILTAMIFPLEGWCGHRAHRGLWHFQSAPGVERSSGPG